MAGLEGALGVLALCGEGELDGGLRWLYCSVCPANI